MTFPPWTIHLSTIAEPEEEVPPRRKHSRQMLWLCAGLALCCVVTTALFWRNSGRPPRVKGIHRPHRIQTHLSEMQTNTTKRVYLRVGTIGSEGFGSALQHFKQSIILSRALDSTLLLASENSEHEYSTSGYTTGRCTQRHSMWTRTPRRAELTRGWCAGEGAALLEMERIKAETAECTGILDGDENELMRRQTTEDLNGCITGWIHERLGPFPPPALPPPLTFPPERAATVGVHIRWGDTAGQWGDGFRGSMGIPDIVRVLTDIRATMGAHGVNLSIAMEDADPRVLARLHETGYTLIDSGDALADLQALSQNDFLLLGQSSYAALAHLIAPPGLTIIDGNDRVHLRGKYNNTTGFGRNVVEMKDYTPKSLRLGWTVKPWWALLVGFTVLTAERVQVQWSASEIPATALPGIDPLSNHPAITFSRQTMSGRELNLPEKPR
ncbi:hypothetical protein B0H13DRAFT_1912832 [Mycena leptocephala]|nr:hypothetical protein B0H13DRAFT_1912832 [Mycena leptocephala]